LYEPQGWCSSGEQGEYFAETHAARDGTEQGPPDTEQKQQDVD
jgi:hypothetical protein